MKTKKQIAGQLAEAALETQQMLVENDAAMRPGLFLDDMPPGFILRRFADPEFAWVASYGSVLVEGKSPADAVELLRARLKAPADAVEAVERLRAKLKEGG